MPYAATPAIDEFDLTITSTTDDDAAVRAAVGLGDPDNAGGEGADEGEGPGAGADPGGDGDGGGKGDRGAESGAEGDGDGEGAADTGEAGQPTDAKAQASARAADEQDTARLAGEVGADYEGPVTGETQEQRLERTERNVKRIQQLAVKVANRDQHISALREEVANLRGRLEGRGDLRPEAGREGVAGDAAATETPFTFPEFEDWMLQPGNDEKTAADHRRAELDAHYEHRRALEDQRAVRMQRDRDTGAALAASEARIEAFRTVTPDYDEVVNTSHAPLTSTMHMSMLHSELGPQIAYHLSKDAAGVAEATRISTLEPLNQVRALMALELTLKGDGAAPRADAAPARTDGEGSDIVRPASRRTTKAPAPATRVPGSARTTRSLEDLSTDEFVAEGDRRDRERGRLR